MLIHKPFELQMFRVCLFWCGVLTDGTVGEERLERHVDFSSIDKCLVAKCLHGSDADLSCTLLVS